MSRRHTLSLCTELPPTGAPGRVQPLPPGPAVTGRDGRAWRFDADDGVRVIDAFTARAAALPIDWEHASQHRAPNGEPAPAAAWIERLELGVDGSLWGVVEWTERGAAQVAAREYRYLSPVFDYEVDSGHIARLVSAGLTNLPNLHLQALNHEHEEIEMNRTALFIAALATLGLAADAADDAIAVAINQLKAAADDATARALNAEKAQPTLERYVPRADYDALATRAANAEQALRERETAEHKAAVDGAIDAALRAGKITPATVEYHRASCSDAAGLERFRAFVGAAPVIGAATDLGTRKPEGSASALNAEERAVCQATGVSEEEFVKARGTAAAAAA